MTILNGTIQRDQAFFHKINSEWTSPILDKVMPWCRESTHWYPFYFVLLALLIYKWRNKVWKWLLFAVITIVATDQISSSFFKPFFHRLRPCVDPLIAPDARLLLSQCSGGFSFTSSHAANHFGIAMFFFLTLGSILGKYRGLLFLWAATIAYAQVYVGVHYPLDIIGGTIIGLTTGYITAKSYQKWMQ